MSASSQKSIETTTLIATMSLSLLIFPPAFIVAAFKAGDYFMHLIFALTMDETGAVLHISNVLFHAVVIGYGQLFPTLPPQTLSALTLITAVEVLCFVLFKLLWWKTSDVLHPVAIMLLTFGLMLIAPIFIWLDDVHMLGYINPVIYHSPTQNLLRIFVIPVSLLAFRALENRPYRNTTHRIFIILLSASLIALASLSKPSFTITIIPALTLYVLYRLWKRQPIDWLLYLFGLCIPAVGIIALQTFVTYTSTYVDPSGMAVGFMAFMLKYVPLWRIPIQLLLSLVFPLAVYGLYFQNARRDVYLNLSWVTLLIGLGYTYFVHETGYRVGDGNFIWTSYSASFVLMFASVIFMVGQYRAYRLANPKPHGALRRLRIVGALFIVHVLSGIVGYFTFMDRFGSM